MDYMDQRQTDNLEGFFRKKRRVKKSYRREKVKCSVSTICDQNKDEKPETKAHCKSMLTELLKRSSVYALNQIGNSATTARKIFWFLILLFGVIGCVFHVSLFLISYYKYPVVVNINAITSRIQTFPAVTVCNMNGIRKEYVHCVEQKSQDGDCSSGKQILKSNLSAPPESLSPCELGYSFIIDNTNKSDLWEILLVSTDYDSRVKYGHEAKHFIRSCYFNFMECGLDDFEHSVSFGHGNCYTFNSKTYSRYLNNSGPGAGLELELDLEIDKYVKHTDDVGALVRVHDPFEDHDIDEKGVKISPGCTTFIGLTKNMHQRLPSPYKDSCKKYDVGDSQATCNSQCNINMTFILCGCSIDKTIHVGIPQCDFTDASVMCCFEDSGDFLTECDCPLSCEETYFNSQMSFATWPSRAYYEANPTKFIRERGDSARYLSFEEAHKTLLKLKVYFDTLDYTVYKQNPLYDSSEVLSQIGGQMGLWLGLSLVAVFECVENILVWCESLAKIKTK